MKITIIYNGIPKEFDTSKGETVGSLMGRAILTYHPPQKLAAIMGFFDREGRELSAESTLSVSRVKDGDDLLMRPTVIR